MTNLARYQWLAGGDAAVLDAPLALGPPGRRARGRVLSMAAFVAPEGLRLERVLGKGTMFQVALVHDGSLALVCKRLTPRLRATPEGPRRDRA
jgi:hypothetical protein